MTELVQVSCDGDVWVVTLNRPDKANALTAKILNELADIADSAKTAKAFILTAAGKVFSAGADLTQIPKGLAGEPVWERLSASIAGIQGLTIAALNGTVAGGSFGMVLACDLRIAVPRANFFYPVMKMGVTPPPSDPSRMSRLIGPARSKMILLAGQKIDADTALTWGLIDRIVAPEDLLTTARELTLGAVDAPASHIAEIKNAV